MNLLVSIVARFLAGELILVELILVELIQR